MLRAVTKTRSAPRLKRPGCCSSARFKNSEHMTGVKVSEIKAEATTATETVTANSRNNRPIMPPIKSSGINTAISEKVIEMIVKPIWPAPLSAASNGRSPCSM